MCDRRGEGRENSESDARARRQQSTVPVEPSTTMLTYRLTGTTEDSGLTAANTTKCPPRPTGRRPHTGRESSRTTVRSEAGAALLTCGYLVGDTGFEHAPRMAVSTIAFS